MQVTAADVERIPRENLRVPRDKFAAVWIEAERRLDDRRREGTAGDAWYETGVAETCRWLACGNEVFNYPQGPVSSPAAAPITGTKKRAHEELIEAELLAAESKAMRYPNGIDGRAGLLEGIVTTLAWAWRGSAVPPLQTHRAEAG